MCSLLAHNEAVSVESGTEIWKAGKPELGFLIPMYSLGKCIQRAWLPPGPGSSVATAPPVPGSAGHCSWQYQVASDEL